MLALLEPAYLSATTPHAQSGKGGDAAAWEYARRLVCDAIHRDGSFLDVGCANGLLMEDLQRWAAADGHAIEPYGVDISAGLADLARARYPQWADRIHTANANGPPERLHPHLGPFGLRDGTLRSRPVGVNAATRRGLRSSLQWVAGGP